MEDASDIMRGFKALCHESCPPQTRTEARQTSPHDLPSDSGAEFYSFWQTYPACTSAAAPFWQSCALCKVACLRTHLTAVQAGVMVEAPHIFQGQRGQGLFQGAREVDIDHGGDLLGTHDKRNGGTHC
eukprot:1153277-Pelagomonas_calceolata.AAC.4